jgi:hypothetical protein
MNPQREPTPLLSWRLSRHGEFAMCVVSSAAGGRTTLDLLVGGTMVTEVFERPEDAIDEAHRRRDALEREGWQEDAAAH